MLGRPRGTSPGHPTCAAGTPCSRKPSPTGTVAAARQPRKRDAWRRRTTASGPTSTASRTRWRSTSPSRASPSPTTHDSPSLPRRVHPSAARRNIAGCTTSAARANSSLGPLASRWAATASTCPASCWPIRPRPSTTSAPASPSRASNPTTTASFPSPVAPSTTTLRAASRLCCALSSAPPTSATTSSSSPAAWPSSPAARPRSSSRR